MAWENTRDQQAMERNDKQVGRENVCVCARVYCACVHNPCRRHHSDLGRALRRTELCVDHDRGGETADGSAKSQLSSQTALRGANR